jgi:hypothetical protein
MAMSLVRLRTKNICAGKGQKQYISWSVSVRVGEGQFVSKCPFKSPQERGSDQSPLVEEEDPRFKLYMSMGK